MKINKYDIANIKEKEILYLADSQYYEVREGYVDNSSYQILLFHYTKKDGSPTHCEITNFSELYTTKEEAEEEVISWIEDDIADYEKEIQRLKKKKDKILKNK